MINNEWTHDEETQKIIEKVGVLINELKNTNINGHALVNVETKLAAYYAYLAGKTAEYQAGMNAHYWIRKIAYSKEYAMLRGKYNQGDSKVMAENLIEEQINDENMSNFRFEHLKMFCKGIEKNLISIAHRLNLLKNEAAQNKHQ